MSTRANIVIKDAHEKLWFYRHSDGYPEGTMPTLEKFLQYVKDGKIRNNVGQAAGWLIIIGHNEYETPDTPDKDWKVGAYEPTTGQHCDIEYLYTVDLQALTIEVQEV